MKTKKIIAGILGTALLLSSTTGLAANKWVFKNYIVNGGLSAQGVYQKLWYEVDGRGLPTGREKIDGMASSVEWRHEFYERDYPHAEIFGLYLDGEYAGVLRDSGAFADWETKFEPEMWEVRYPYCIFERLKSNVPGIGWRANTLVHRGLTQADLLKYLGKNERVTRSYVFFSVGPYRIINKDTINEDTYRPGATQALFNNFYWFNRDAEATTVNGDYIVDARALLNAAGYSDATIDASFPVNAWPLNNPDELGRTNPDGTFVWRNDDIANLISVFKSEYLTGSDYVNGGTQTIDVASYYASRVGADMTAADFDPDFITYSPIDKPVTISWTNETFEAPAGLFNQPQIQYLIVNGLVCDGRWLGRDLTGADIWAPYVFRRLAGNVFGVPETFEPQNPFINDPVNSSVINGVNDAASKALNP